MKDKRTVAELDAAIARQMEITEDWREKMNASLDVCSELEQKRDRAWTAQRTRDGAEGAKLQLAAHFVQDLECVGISRSIEEMETFAERFLTIILRDSCDDGTPWCEVHDCYHSETACHHLHALLNRKDSEPDGN